ncbi:MAG: hypothetical protein FRX49_02026 [Trebouxia sp. A1-2]|nr:MAG: hypothetical protein FRX49_02026 [Trebouxia sp. A1-2]
MPEDMLCPRQNLASLTAATYGDLQQHHADSQYLSERAILTLKSRDGNAINDMILQSFPGEPGVMRGDPSFSKYVIKSLESSPKAPAYSVLPPLCNNSSSSKACRQNREEDGSHGGKEQTGGWGAAQWTDKREGGDLEDLQAGLMDGAHNSAPGAHRVLH